MVRVVWNRRYRQARVEARCSTTMSYGKRWNTLESGRTGDGLECSLGGIFAQNDGAEPEDIYAFAAQLSSEFATLLECAEGTP